ncbi:MAG: hypothetical protein OXB88_05190 [Bacteriovoracales bacterium]|nr:hypothetical protein [Bacteriovoracales bacterium]
MVTTPADILWVIDNSPSMKKHHRNLIRNMNIFINNFITNSQLIKWRMGLLSTSESEAPYIGLSPGNYLDSSDVNPYSRFSSAIFHLGTGGDYEEKSFTPIRNALESFPDFLRDDSKLFIIIVSDEKEQSKESVEEFLGFLKSLRPLSSISAYGIFEKKEDGCGGLRFKGSRYDRFIQFTGGLSSEICDDEYGLALAAFSTDIVKKVMTTKIYLDSVPIIETIQVLYEGGAISPGKSSEGGYWRYDISENAISFHDLSFLKEGDDTEKIKIVFEKMPLFDQTVGVLD